MLQVDNNHALTSLRFMILISIIMGAIVAGAGLGFSFLSEFSVAPSASLLFGLCITLGMTTVIVSLQTHASQDSYEIKLLRKCSLLGVAVVFLCMHTLLMPRVADYFLLSHGLGIAVNAAILFLSVSLAITFLQVHGNWPNRVALSLTSMYFLIGAISIAIPGFLETPVASFLLAATRDLSLLLVPVAVIILSILPTELRLSPHGLAENLRLRWHPSPQNFHEIIAGVLMIVAPTLSGILVALAAISELLLSSINLNLVVKIATTTQLAGFSVAWLGALWYGVMSLVKSRQSAVENLKILKLINPATRRFMFRHRSDASYWAATVGVRTASFVLDHDPNKALHNNLPATMGQIRSDEIQRSIAVMLGKRHLYSRYIDDSIIGTLDPEQCIKPCVEVLNLFSSLYLDAIPLVERRLKRLAEVLPIIDPDLAKFVTPQSVANITSRNGWLFQLTFDWTDQQIIGRPEETRYGVHTRELMGSTRHSVLDFLYQENRLGNYVWLSDDARLQLLREAPLLKSAITTFTIEHHSGDIKEIPIFLAKFEELIPRLQKYYNLDIMRESLRDYEPSRESIQLLNLIDLQLAEPINPEQTHYVLSTIASYPWRGFKEKDSVLHLILKARKQLKEFLAASDWSEDAVAEIETGATSYFKAAICQIGYPSQSLHEAQVAKVALRHMKTAITTAQNPGHPRHNEAWLLLATADPKRYQTSEILECLHFLGSVADMEHLAGDTFVATKALEAMVNFSQMLDGSESALITNLVNPIFRCFLEHNFSPEKIALLLDAIIYFNDYFEEPIVVSDQNRMQMDVYVEQVKRHFGIQTPFASSIVARWELLQPTKNLPVHRASA